MSKLGLPGVIGYNPRIWDKVIEGPRVTVAIAFTESGKKKMFEMGWGDAVDGKLARSTNEHYDKGFRQGQLDLQG